MCIVYYALLHWGPPYPISLLLPYSIVGRSFIDITH